MATTPNPARRRTARLQSAAGLQGELWQDATAPDAAGRKAPIQDALWSDEAPAAAADDAPAAPAEEAPVGISWLTMGPADFGHAPRPAQQMALAPRSDGCGTVDLFAVAGE